MEELEELRLHDKMISKIKIDLISNEFQFFIQDGINGKNGFLFKGINNLEIKNLLNGEDCEITNVNCKFEKNNNCYYIEIIILNGFGFEDAQISFKFISFDYF